MPKVVLIVLLTIGAILAGIGIRFRGTRYSSAIAAVGFVVIAITVALRLAVGGE